MKRTGGAQSEVGMFYQYAVTALLASELSENDQIDDYIIYSSELSAGKFDDVIARIKLKDQDDWYLSLIQVKYKAGKKLNVSDNLRGKRVDRFISDYIQSCYEILENPKLTCRQGIPSDNVRFAIYSDKAIQIPVYLRQDAETTFQLKVSPCVQKSNTLENNLLPFGNKYWKFVCKDLENSKQQKFFDRCCLFLEQLKHNKLNKHIEKVCAISSAKEIINYVKDFFNDDDLYKQGLSKQVFDIELQRIRVFDAISPLTSLEDLAADAPVEILNKIILEHDITAVNYKQDFLIEPCLYSCLVRRINTLLDVNIDWETNERLDSEIIRKFIEYSRSKKVRYWIDIPSTLRLLIIEMWKCGDLPLILKTRANLNAFEKYARLRRSYIVLDDWSNRLGEVSISKLKIFNSLGSVANLELQDLMLKSTFVSLQGREPVSLKNLFIDDTELMSTFACADIFRMMRKRIPFLREDYFKGSNYLVFMVEDEQCKEIFDRIDPYIIGHDVTISHPPNKKDECLEIIRKHADIFQNYTIYRLRRIGEMFALIEGDPNKLRHLFVDQYSDPLHTSSSNDESVSIIGQPTVLNELQYVPRKLSRPTLPMSFIDSDKTQICFLSNDFGLNFEITNADDIANGIISIERKTYFVKIDDKEKRQLYWRKLCELGYPILDIYINDGELNLLRFQNCKKLVPHITYNGGKYSENEFMGEIRDDANGISVVTGDAGMGKTSFLKRLCNNYSTTHYIVFYDLINLQVDLNKSESEKINLTEFIFKKIRKDLPNKYIDFMTCLWEKNRLIWVLDSFDEIRLACEKQVLDFIHFIAKSGAQIIIATRTENCEILMDEFGVRLIKIEPLEKDEYSLYWNLNQNLLNDISPDLLTNPLYLNFLNMISIDKVQLLNITKFSLYEKVINMNIRCCLRRTYRVLYDSEVERIVSLFERLALVEMFGKEMIERELYWIVDNEVSDMTKFGIIVRFNEDDIPIFYHRSFVEFLVAQWMAKSCRINVYKAPTKYIYKQVLNANKLQVFNILFEDIKLHDEILKESPHEVKEMIEKDPACLNIVDKLGRTPLHAVTITCGYSNNIISYQILHLVLTSMLENGYDMDKPDIMSLNWYEYVRPEIFEFACEFDMIKVIQIFLRFYRRKVEKDNSISVIFPTKYFKWLFVNGINSHSIDMIGDLVFLQNFDNRIFRKFYGACVESNPEPISWTRDIQFDGNLTLLHVASIYGSVSMTRHLIDVGADTLAVDNATCIPLHYSIMRCCLSDLENNNIGAEMLSTRSNNLDAIKLLLQANPQSILYNIQTAITLSPLSLAVISRNINVVRLLLERGARICPDRMYTSHTPLHFAVLVGDLDIVRYLLDNKAPRFHKNHKGETAMDYAVQLNKTEIVEVLQERTDIAEDIQQSEDRRPVYLSTKICRDPEVAPLCDAMNSNNIDLIKVLFRKGYDVNRRDGYGETPLHCALRVNPQLVTLLLDLGADINARDKYGVTPLLLAANRCDVSVIETLLDKGVSVNDADAHSESPLFSAVAYNDISVVRLLLERGANTDFRHETGYTALHQAVYVASEDKVQLLLEYGANMEIPELKGYTPLHTSVMKGHTTISKLLIQKGANTDAYAKDGRTPLLFAVYKQDIDIAELLIEKGAKLNFEDIDGNTPLHIAICIGYENIARLLLKKGANINAQNKKGYSVLFAAIEYNRIDILKLLLKANVNLDRASENIALYSITSHGDIHLAMLLKDKGLNVNAYTENRTTPLHIAAVKGYSIIVKLLLQQGAHVNAVDKLGRPPLHYAVPFEHEATVQILIDGGADVNIKEKDGMTSFSLAFKTQNFNILKLLLEANVNIDREDYAKTLKFAVCQKSIDTIKLLLNKNETANIYSDNDYTLLYLAALAERADIIDLLVEKVIDMNTTIGYDIASFSTSLINGDLQLITLLNEGPKNTSKIAQEYRDFTKLLIEEGADIIYRTQKGKNSLKITLSCPMDIIFKLLHVKAPTSNDGNILIRFAARQGKRDLVERLLNEEVRTITDTVNGTTLLHDCACEGNVNIMKLLLDRMIDVNIQDNMGNTPLHFGVIEEHVDVVELLLGANANPHVPNCNQETPLQLAVRRIYGGSRHSEDTKNGDTSLEFKTKNEHVEIIWLLLEHMTNVSVNDEDVIRIIYWAVVEGHWKIIKLLLRKCNNLI